MSRLTRNDGPLHSAARRGGWVSPRDHDLCVSGHDDVATRVLDANGARHGLEEALATRAAVQFRAALAGHDDHFELGRVVDVWWHEAHQWGDGASCTEV